MQSEGTLQYIYGDSTLTGIETHQDTQRPVHIRAAWIELNSIQVAGGRWHGRAVLLMWHGTIYCVNGPKFQYAGSGEEAISHRGPCCCSSSALNTNASTMTQTRACPDE